MVRKAEFDHVDDNGVIILTIGDEHVELVDSDEFEQGLLASKQIKAEARTDALPPETEGLPISQIQNLVRAGLPTDKIAEKYGMEPALIRRFAQPIEQEKKSAISQFLTVTIRQNDELHRLGELIHSVLVQAGVDTASVEWSASRRRREPWRISAFFPHDDRTYKATWSWNMRDNAVVAINPTAKKLLGQSDAAARDLLFGDDSDMSISTNVPQSGPNPPSWMIEGSKDSGDETVPADTRVSETQPSVAPASAALNSMSTNPAYNNDSSLISETDDRTSSLQPQDDVTTTIAPLAQQEKSNDQGQSRASAVFPFSSTPRSKKSRSTVAGAAAEGEETHTALPAAREGQSAEGATNTAAQESAHNNSAATPSQSPRTDSHDTASAKNEKNDKKHARRTAIPSWDDIIFGE